MKKVKENNSGLHWYSQCCFASQVTAFAAGTESKTVTATKDMSIALMPGVTGDSNTITFNFNSLPDNAIVKEVKIDCSNASVIGGKGAILAQNLTITCPSGETHTVGWGKGNVTTTSLFIAEKAAGTWSVYMTGTNCISKSWLCIYQGYKIFTA